MQDHAVMDATSARLLLGDEAVALAAIDAGVSAAYGYPGTPSTEILETIIAYATGRDGLHASWAANEKTAYEQALGASMAGRRSIVTMKHVGLNVAADPFVNSALVSLRGGLVVAVADDPGMHSSQNEQDSRLLADFAKVPCLEPADPQEAYDMTREAFDLSERHHIPVVLRLVTRLSHGRAAVVRRPAREPNASAFRREAGSWVLLPANARQRWTQVLDLYAALEAESDASPHNPLDLPEGHPRRGIITTGSALNYFSENARDLSQPLAHLHIGAYPIPADKVRQLVAACRSVLVIEQGQPWVERALRGLLASDVEIRGKMSGALPPAGELTPEAVREAMGLSPRPVGRATDFAVPPRPPQLCAGCPHRDTYVAIREALRPDEHPVITSDIGCYTLGVLPPIGIGDSCVCMGASIGMAKGASEAGVRPAIAVIGDGTFFHSGVAPLMDAAAANTNMTVVILDNETTGMTGLQPTVLPSSRLRDVIVGTGVPAEHCHLIEAHPRRVGEMTRVIRAAIDHPGLSVVISRRECIESAKRHKVPVKAS